MLTIGYMHQMYPSAAIGYVIKYIKGGYRDSLFDSVDYDIKRTNKITASLCCPAM